MAAEREAAAPEDGKMPDSKITSREFAATKADAVRVIIPHIILRPRGVGAVAREIRDRRPFREKTMRARNTESGTAVWDSADYGILAAT